MKPDPTSLDRLHDLVLPPAVLSWWPPAPGWYALFVLLALAGGWLAWRGWQHWRADAYRRAALHELANLRDVTAVAELLRRTALAVVPRPVVAGMTGTAWTDWLAAHCAEAMPDPVRTRLYPGVYGRPAPDQDLAMLRAYAACWIARHHLVSADDRRMD
jgi:hypothetical protein